jgi:hypothetical protein
MEVSPSHRRPLVARLKPPLAGLESVGWLFCFLGDGFVRLEASSSNAALRLMGGRNATEQALRWEARS